MAAMQLMTILFIILFACAMLTEQNGDDPVNTPKRLQRLVDGSVTVEMPLSWIAHEDSSTVGKIMIISDPKLREAQTPADGAMGVFIIEVSTDIRAPADILALKLYNEGGPPAGAEIEVLAINDNPAARMSALDQLFGDEYLWYAAVIQFDDEIAVYTAFTGLGDYAENGVINAVVESISVDVAVFKVALSAD